MKYREKQGTKNEKNTRRFLPKDQRPKTILPFHLLPLKLISNNIRFQFWDRVYNAFHLIVMQEQLELLIYLLIIENSKRKRYTAFDWMWWKMKKKNIVWRKNEDPFPLCSILCRILSGGCFCPSRVVQCSIKKKKLILKWTAWQIKIIRMMQWRHAVFFFFHFLLFQSSNWMAMFCLRQLIVCWNSGLFSFLFYSHWDDGSTSKKEQMFSVRSTVSKMSVQLFNASNSISTSIDHHIKRIITKT